ncbi:MAG: hypothetical protein HQM13_00855 [SAR324 cluster bacterium]|nr:hypothetical protein [SAR324 cluster bacterium]
MMSLLKTIKGKFILLLWILVLSMALAIKFYFIPQTDRFLEKSVEHDMKRNMEAFTKIIVTVVKAADGNHQVVRRALGNINADPDIPVTLLRSQAIANQFGEVSKKNTQTLRDERVFREGLPIFQKKQTKFEYAFPLKAEKVCQTCHLSEDKTKVVPIGYVLGVAVASVPFDALRENNLFFFVKDLFVVNMILFTLALLAIYLVFYFLVNRPLENLQTSLSDLTADEDEYHQFEMEDNVHDEIAILELHIKELVKRLPSKE